jgi:glutamate N-acetyltransferase/amino-acid N-acetyltransferase
MQSAFELCRSLAEAGACGVDQVLPFSTGVIGEPLPVDRMKAAIPQVLGTLNDAGWADASRAIMTTDTLPKLTSRTLVLQGHTLTVTGMAKGAGMICPDMATMLAFLATDAKVDQGLLQSCLERAVQGSFNAISVDGDTSTNDACVLMATGQSGSELIGDRDSDAFNALCDAVTEVCMTLARAIVQDGEGATKLVKVQVDGARSRAEARQVAYTIAHSPLVKTALFASDPNWGRILAAVGRAGVEDLDIERVQIWLDNVCIVRNGGRAGDYTEEAGRSVMERDEYVIRVGLYRGDLEASVLTCDLSYDYVRINAEYRT